MKKKKKKKSCRVKNGMKERHGENEKEKRK